MTQPSNARRMFECICILPRAILVFASLFSFKPNKIMQVSGLTIDVFGNLTSCWIVWVLVLILRLRPGRTFVHCAQGLGRTGLFALALLLSSGAAMQTSGLNIDGFGD